MKAVHFGAGNIGRGFIGPLLMKAGFELTLLDVEATLVEALQLRGGYSLQLGTTPITTEWIGPVAAYHANSTEAEAALLACDLITLSIGVTHLPAVAPALAAILKKRAELDRPLNILACENALRATSQLRRAIEPLLGDSEIAEWVARSVGFADTSVDRIVFAQPTEQDPLALLTEPFCEWIVDSTQLQGALEIPGLTQTEALTAYLTRKLFTLNTGHATAAYLGIRRGYTHLGPALNDSALYETVRSAMEESGRALLTEFSVFSESQHTLYLNAILARFRNPCLNDLLVRVARNPLRKLQPTDRLVGPLRATYLHGLPHEGLLLGTAAALAYRHPDDPDTPQLASLLEETSSPLEGIRRITGITEPTLLQRLAEQYKGFQNG